MKPVKVTIEEMYEGGEENYRAFLAVLDKSLNPRSPDILYDKFKELGPTSDSIVLDAGCRYAAQACELHQRFGCKVVGVDLVADNIKEAQERIAAKEFGHAVKAFRGDIHELPFEDEIFDFIWCRDVLGHMRDLHRAFDSCARVLKPGGQMLIYEMFETELLTDEEAAFLWTSTATVRENMQHDYFEKALAAAGFSVIEADVLGSEWREYGEETDSKITSKQLLRIARMRRDRERLIAEFGEKTYASELANCHWGVYQILGRLSPSIYTLKKD